MPQSPTKAQDVRNDKSAIVIGAGIVGVCSAWHLRRNGFDVTVLDRKDPGEETSWGNMGLIQHLSPAPFPRSIGDRISIVLNQSDAMHLRPTALLRYLPAILRYWWCSMPQTYQQVVSDYSTLVKHCTDEHGVIMKAAKAEKLVRKSGFYEVSARRSVADLQEAVDRLRNAGVAVSALTGEEFEKQEPAVAPGYFQAALFFPDTWCVEDPGALVKAYAASVVAAGGKVQRANVSALIPPAGNESGKASRWVVQTDVGDYEAAHVVVAAGPWSTEVVRPLGYRLPLYPLRGYSTHFGTPSGLKSLSSAIIDMDHGVGIAPMRQGMRLTTGGELATIESPPNLVQLNAVMAAVKQYLPLGEQLSPVWHGHRPCLPDMKPIIGPAPNHEGLWMCFGHAGNGLTLAAVSGRLIGELVGGGTPFVDPKPFSADRFSWT